MFTAIFIEALTLKHLEKNILGNFSSDKELQTLFSE